MPPLQAIQSMAFHGGQLLQMPETGLCVNLPRCCATVELEYRHTESGATLPC